MKETVKLETITTRQELLAYTCSLWAMAFIVFVLGVGVGYLLGAM